MKKLLDGSGNPIAVVEPEAAAAPKPGFRPNPELAAQLRKLADYTEQGFVGAGAFVFLLGAEDQLLPQAITATSDFQPWRPQLGWSLMNLVHILQGTEERQRMASPPQEVR